MITTGVTPEQYLDPEIAPGLPWRDLPIVDARDPSLADLLLVAEGDPAAFDVPITPWPVTGGRPLDPGTGVEGGTTEGRFTTTWAGLRLNAVNEAVGGAYVIGLGDAPERLDDAQGPAEQILLWHLNHHPDGGQLFWSVDGRPFLVPVVPAGDSPDLDRAVVARSDGSFGICVRAGVWHDGVYPEAGDGAFRTRQGRVHARVSADVAREFGCLLRIPLPTSQ
jgi:hypothetical protein